MGTDRGQITQTDPGLKAVLTWAVALAYGGVFWMVVLHGIEGSHERGEPALLVHWLRDASLALPVVAFAAWRGLVGAGRLLARGGSAPVWLRRAVTPAVMAAATACALAIGNPVHALLFEASEGHHLPLLLHLMRDTTLALAATLPIAWAVDAVGTVQWRSVLRPGICLRRAFAPAMATGMLVTSALTPIAATAATDPGSPCPESAPVTRFEVQAIDVDIPLNRFGDHDPSGKMYVLDDRVDDVRDQERTQDVSIGLREDAIQPLVIRANLGDCVEISYANNASGGNFGIHIDGLAFETGSSGDAIGNNPPSDVPTGQSTLYRYFIPKDPTLEGAHYMHPGPGYRDAVSHGLFGALVVEPRGSTYISPIDGAALESGWDATIVYPTGAAFREPVLLFHEVGNEDFDILDAEGDEVPTVDPHTDAYRPGTRALNYRSESFMNRLEADPRLKSLGYGSYTFGDPATPIPRGYLGDPTKIRLVHTGSEMFHVFHLHGGGIRWRFNPESDPTFDYADTGLDKQPKTDLSPSTRLDSQSMGPGESFNLEIEGGAGGVQQAAGDFLWHCHIAHHYVAGMWSFWRVFNTRQPSLEPLPDQPTPLRAVDSSELIGQTMPDGTTLTAANLDEWIRPQLPPQGVRQVSQDASVWDWTVDATDPDKPIYLREPDDTRPWPNHDPAVAGHLSSFPGDEYVQNRSKILFNPLNGRPAYPLLRPHIGKRPPFSPNGHSGAPYLGEDGEVASPGVDPWAGRADGLCPAGSRTRRFNVVSVELPIQVTRQGGLLGTDPNGMLFTLAQDKADLLAGRRPAEPLAIRANIGDCAAVTLTSEMNDATDAHAFSKVNMHIHHVQFDPQASDGVISGMAFEQSVRPYKAEDPQLTAPAAAGSSTLQLQSVAKFQPGVWIGVGLGTDGIEIRRITSIDPAASTVTLNRPLSATHAAGEWAGVEFVQYRWYPDVELDNIFWHDHVDGINSWGHGLVGQFIIEPKGSTYHDPVTGEEVDSGTYVDIHTSNPLAPGLVEGSYRELALWEIDENPVTDSTFNLRAEPWSDRGGGDPSTLFSSYRHGDPFTPLPRAYPGDPFVIRTIQVGPSVDTFHLDGHRFFLENRYLDPAGRVESTPVDTIHYGISERFTLILDGGAGGPREKPGDYLYMNGLGRRFEQGAWGLLRVLPGQVGDLRPLPGNPAPSGGGGIPSQTGGRPPAASGPGDPCPAGAPQRSFDVSAVDLPTLLEGREAAFVPTAQAAGVRSGAISAEPLVLHTAAGECITVRLRNQRDGERASFHLSELQRDPESSGINVGFNPEQTVAPGGTRTYRYYADTHKLGAALISDFGEEDTGGLGLYGALVVAPQGASFTDPRSGNPQDVGTKVDVHVPGKPGYRDFTLAFSEDDPRMGQSDMPYHTAVEGPALVNYESAPRPDGPDAFSSIVNGDPPTPLLRAYAGDPVRVHVLGAPGSEQIHVFNLGGLNWPSDPFIHESEQIASHGFGPWETFDAEMVGGAGGMTRARGDFFYGDLRRPFTQAGMWGLLRVLSDQSCPIQPLDGLTCDGLPSLTHDDIPPTVTAEPPGGNFQNAQSVTLTASEPSMIFYTTDGSTPNARSHQYTGPIDIATTTTLKFMARDEAKNESEVFTETYRIAADEDPVVQAPTERIGPRLQTTNVPVKLQWSATDDGSIAAYELQKSTNGSGYVAVALPTPTSTTKTVQLAPGSNTYRFRVRARDDTGNWSPFAEGQPFKITAHQESAAAITYTGTWTQAALSGAYGGSVRHTSVAGRKATISFSGRDVAWVTTLGPNRGKAEVRLDGALVATVDLYAATTTTRKVVFTAETPAGPHTLEVRATGTKRAASTGTRVDVDAFVILA